MAGIEAREYWELTLYEIQKTIKAYSDKEEKLIKEKASFTYIQGTLVLKAISAALGRGGYPTAHEVFPSLFEAPRKEQSWQMFKANLMKYSDANNQKFGKEVKE